MLIYGAFSFAQQYNYFRYPDISSTIDYDSGKSLLIHYREMEFNNVEKIKRALITRKNNEGVECYEYFYENGLVHKEIHRINSGTNIYTYKYNEKSFITDYNGLTFEYVDDNVRDSFNEGVFRNRQILTEETNHKKIEEKVQNKRFDHLIIRYAYDYYYENGKLTEYVTTDYSCLEEGIVTGNTRLKFEYDKNGRLTTVYRYFIDSDSLVIYTVSYDKKKNISKITIKDKQRPSDNRTIFYYDYDNYGNFHRAVHYNNKNKIVKEYSRTIEYLDAEE